MEHKFSFKKVLSILVVLTMVFSSVAAFAFTADAEGEDVILIDAINAASWGEDDVPFAPILVYGTENNVGGYIGGVWNAWWYKIIATYDKDADLFIVDEKLANDGNVSYADVTLGEGQIMILVYTGNEAVVRTTCDTAEKVQAGDALKATGFDFTNAGASDLASKNGDSFTSPVYFTLTAKEEAKPEVKVENIALGKAYTYSQLFRQGGREAGWGWDENAAISYPDEDGMTMTDGVIAADDVAYDDAVWAGWNHNAPDYKEIGYSWITVDLGAVTDLAEASIYLGASGLGSGIGAKNMTVEILVSDDGEEFASVGSAVPEDTEEVSCVKTTVKFDTAVSGRYVQFRMVRGGWMFVSEVEVYNAGSGSTTTTVKEEITVDGDISDNGWAEDGWTEVTSDNGYWQALPTTDTLSYKYQLRTDDTKLYAAVEIDCAAVEGGNGKGTNVRFWINSDDEATVYTHFYDVFVGGTGAKYNQAKDANKGAAIENSTINAVLTTEGEKTFVEFSVDLAEFNGAEGFNYFICVSNKINENVCLYFPAVVEGESRLSNLPYNVWYAEGQGVADVEELALGEITVDNGSDDEEEPKEDVEAEMKELLGAAPADAKVDYVIDAPAEYKAGDEITVTVTVKNITAENGIHVAAFKLLYDNEKLLITNDLDEEDENALVCVKTLPKDWENLSSVANDYNADNEEGTVVNPLNDGVINVSVFTAKSAASAAIKEDGALVLEFTFKALEDAEGDIGLVIPNETAECAFNGKEGEIVYEANGSYAVIKAPVVEEESKPESKPEDPVKPGDASSMIIFAIIALVALAGSAVVIKTRK